MPAVLDTNIAIHLRDGDRAISRRFANLSEAAYLSVISRIELENGVWRNLAEGASRRARLDVLLEGLIALPFGEEEALAYRGIVEVKGFSRRKVADRMIAAQALILRATLVTRNPDDFDDVPGLQLDVW